jgi:hypothetical protein
MYDELIEALRLCAKYGKADDALENAKQAADAIEELICEVADEHNARIDAEERQRWIPVAERLPQEREWVLCQCRASIRMVLRLQNGYWHQDSRHEFMSGFVTHWMPLPEPPKEET